MGVSDIQSKQATPKKESNFRSSGRSASQAAYLLDLTILLGLDEDVLTLLAVRVRLADLAVDREFTVVL